MYVFILTTIFIFSSDHNTVHSVLYARAKNKSFWRVVSLITDLDAIKCSACFTETSSVVLGDEMQNWRLKQPRWCGRQRKSW